VADPFLVKDGLRWHLFFELFNSESGRGEIGVAESSDLATWKFQKVVLAEPFHLSYPFVFKEGDSYYMIPETRASRSIRLYKATNYPLEWRMEKVLIEGNYADSSPVYFNNKWWIFTCKAPYSLAIFFADSLLGPWQEHPESPMYWRDSSKARPGGRPIVHDGKLIRFAQDNREGYGKKLRAMIVDTLTTEEFVEHPATPDPIFEAHGDRWARDGMHHLAPIQLADGTWVAAIDGSGDGKPAGANAPF
jgi:hypothetical protein